MNDQKPTVNPVPVGGIAKIASVRACAQAIVRTADRHKLLPGLAVFYGHSGLGKSIAACYVANTTRAYYVQAKSTFTKRAFLEAVLSEMSIRPATTLSKMLDQAAGELAKSNRPLIVDEFDFLVSAAKVELVRDLYEGSQGTILCIGEEVLPQKLEKWERFHGRVLNWTPCPTASVDDAKLLHPIYAPSIQIEDSIFEDLVAKVRGSTRRIAINLELMHEQAIDSGLKNINQSNLKKLLPAGFVTGESPKPRTFF